MTKAIDIVMGTLALLYGGVVGCCDQLRRLGVRIFTQK